MITIIFVGSGFSLLFSQIAVYELITGYLRIRKEFGEIVDFDTKVFPDSI